MMRRISPTGKRRSRNNCSFFNFNIIIVRFYREFSFHFDETHLMLVTDQSIFKHKISQGNWIWGCKREICENFFNHFLDSLDWWSNCSIHFKFTIEKISKMCRIPQRPLISVPSRSLFSGFILYENSHSHIIQMNHSTYLEYCNKT